MENQEVINSDMCSGETILQPVTNRRSKIWDNFYLVLDKNSKEQGLVQCKSCQKNLKYSGSRGGTSHLNRHKCATITPQAQNIALFFPKKTQVTTQTKDEIINACVKFCAKDIRPFGIVKGAGFRNLAQKLIAVGASYGNIDVNEVIPHPTTISKHVGEIAIRVRQKIFPEIRNAMHNSCCASTIDLWMDDFKKISFLTMTVQYINDDWILVNRVIFTSTLQEERKSAENIKKELIKKFEKLGFEEELLKKITFVTDQGANMIKAMHNHERFSCYAHIINTILRNTFNEEYLGKYARDFLNVIHHSKTLVTFLKQSGLVTKLKHSVRQEVETRWNSRLAMLESILIQYNCIEDLMDERHLNYLENISKETLQELVSFLKPFKHASDALECEKMPSIQLVLLYKLKLLKHLEVSVSDSALMKCLKERCAHYVDVKYKIFPIHKMSLFLWPEFRQLRMLTEFERTEILSDIREQMDLMNGNIESSEIVPPSPKRIKTSEFGEWADIYDNGELHLNSVSRKELSKYMDYHIDDGISILEFWKTHESIFPLLSKLARRYLCIPASSASSERNFSTAGITFAQRRTNLKEETVDDLLFLHSNLEF